MNDNLSINNRLVSVNEGFNRGNMFDNLFWPYKYIAELKPTSEKEELMNKVQMYCFAAHEMNLYLDVYPNDMQAIGLFNQYKELEKNYKNATRSIKILILEKIIFFIIKVNTLKAIKNNYNDNNLLKTYNAIISNLVKQFIDIKTFELPVNFC